MIPGMGSDVAVVDRVEVAGRADGRWEVHWKIAGDCDTVDLAWGRSADGLDHAHLARVPARPGQALVDPRALPGEGRLYVSVAPSTGRAPGAGPGATVAGERRIGLEGPVNFRDLGGYRGRSGRAVRWGRVFRSDVLLLGDGDLDVFAGLGIRTVYDLRSEGEREAVPNRLPAQGAPALVVLPLVSERAEDSPLEGLDHADGETFLEQLYLHILERSAGNFGRVLTGLACEQDLPAVFHCAAGKDRTGMVAAVLLSVLGVSVEDILDDYELTGRYRSAEHVQASLTRLGETAGMAPEVAAGILRAPRWAMQSALAQVWERYGDFDGYLSGPAGAGADVPERLRDLLLAP